MRDQQAIWQPSPFFEAGREGNVPLVVMIHGTAGGSSASAIANWFQNPDARVSTHYIIGQDGTLEEAVDESDTAWGNGGFTAQGTFWDALLAGRNPNLITISIEFVKSSDTNSDQITDAQKAVGFSLIKRIIQRHGIPARACDASGGIAGHCSVDPANRPDCPGPFPFDELYAYLGKEDTLQITLDVPQVKGFFVQAPGGAWHCPSTGCTIGGAILSFYQKFGNSGDCGLTHLGLPKSNEIGVPGHPGCVIQKFERGDVAYDVAHQLDNPPGAGSVYLLHTDSPFLVGVK